MIRVETIALPKHQMKKVPSQNLVPESLTTWLRLEGRGIITLVGAGGKTTLMYRLAGELVKSGHKVLTTTTTRIAWPDPKQTPVVLAPRSDSGLLKPLARGLGRSGHVTVGLCSGASAKKLEGLDPARIDNMLEVLPVDWILVEGDGAARKPLKAPAVYEPVIPSRTCLVLGVIGLNCLGRKLNEANVHRAELFSHLSRCPMGGSIDTESLAVLICHGEGLLKNRPAGAKGAVFLNQAETERRIEAGREIIRLARKRCRPILETAALGCARDSLPVYWKI